MTNGVKGAVVLYVYVVDARFIDERSTGGCDELIVLGCDDGDLVAWLYDGPAVVELDNGLAGGRQLVAGVTAKCVEDSRHEVAGDVSKEVSQLD
mgnify:CR=1 FL=1